MFKIKLIVCVMLFLMSGTVYAGYQSHKTADAVGDYTTSIVLDANGNGHFSYLDGTNSDLKYEKTDDASWSIEVVDTAGNVGHETSLALDANGNPHISYQDYTNRDLKYAKKTGSSWSIETIDTTGIIGECTSIALDVSGNPHISYYDNTNDDLKYAKKTGGSWTIETVDATGDVGFATSLALDANGNPHISYHDITNRDLKYAEKTGGSWSIETVDAAGEVGHSTSLALDANGNPHIGYLDYTNRDLKYAKKTGSSWSIETVDGPADVGWYTSIALDANGNPHISYQDQTNRDLKYAKKTGASWSIETVDAAGNVGELTSLALDANGNPHISYHDYTNRDLKYAQKTGGSWSIEVVDAAGNVGRYTSLALDADGNTHISYLDDTNGDLRYATTKITIVATIDIDPDALNLNSHGQWITCYIELPEDPSVEDIDKSTVALIAIDGEPLEPPLYRVGPTGIGDEDEDSIPDLMVKFDREDLIEILEEILGTLEHGVYVELTVMGKLADGTTLLTGSKKGYDVVEPVGREPADGTEFVGVDTIRVIKGRTRSIGPQSAGEIPYIFALYETYPNPFSNRARVDYALPNRVAVDIKVYDVSGELVKTLVSEQLDPGYYQVDWHGNDDHGRSASAGVYFIRMVTKEYKSQHKVIFVR